MDTQQSSLIMTSFLAWPCEVFARSNGSLLPFHEMVLDQTQARTIEQSGASFFVRNVVFKIPLYTTYVSYIVIVCLPRHTKYRTCHAKSEIWRSKMQHFSGNLRPDLLTSLMNVSLVLCLPGDIHLCRSSSCTFPTSQLPKVLWHRGVFWNIMYVYTHGHMDKKK